MKNIFKGSLKGYVCEDCLEEISNVEVLLYLPYRKETLTTDSATNLKESFRYVSKEEAKKRENLFIGKTTTDKNGDFEFEINEKYMSADFDIDFVCGSVPKKIPKPKRNELVQFHITTLSMSLELEKQAKNQNYRWEYAIAYKWWCYIRGYFFDAWVICGHLMNCNTSKPIANAEVTAMDADFLTDDNLGSATTDANGHFRIDYSSADFKKTFLSPWINLETDPSLPLTFQSGPDVYFKAKLSGTMLVDETKADARKNVGYCLCVNLCSKISVTRPEETFPSMWAGIGTAFSSSFGSGPHDFDADGFAGSGKHVLFSTIDLTGQAPLKSASGNPIEYRFLLSDTTTPNGGPSPALSNFTKIVGLTPGLFVPSPIIKLTHDNLTFIPNIISVSSHQDDFDSEGWFDASHAVERALINAGLTLADLDDFGFMDEDNLISINTTVLTSAPNVPDTINPGQNIPFGNKIPVEKFAIRFEVREVINKPLNQFAPIPGTGRTLNSVIMNNNLIYRKLAIAELESNLCNPISGTLHAKYTVYHPYLSTCSLKLRKNSAIVESNILDGVINAVPAVDERTNNSSQLNNPPSMARCTYILKLYSSTRKHNGRDGDSNGSDALEQLFFYDV